MAEKIKGVTSRTKNGVEYWYALVGGRRKYCGKNEEGYELAVLARHEAVKNKTVRKLMGLGMRDEVKQIQAEESEFRTVTDLSNWFMQLPSVQKLPSYYGRISGCAHLLAYFGKHSVDQIGTEGQERYRELRYKEGAAPGTVDNEISLLRTMYRKAKKAKKIHADVMPGEFITANEVNPRRTITDDEFVRLTGAADSDFRDLLICGYETAMRKAEIINLRVNQVHTGVRHISGKVVDYIDLGIFDTKTGTRRTIPISATLKEVIQRRIEGLDAEAYVFTKNGRPFRPKYVTLLMKRYCEAAGIPYGDKILNSKGERIGIVFHCLRHTRTTKWVEMGFSDEIIRRATGHRDLRAYQNYVKLDPAVVMRLVEDGTKPVQKLRESAL